MSDCFLPPATQSQHHTELQCHSAELLHDVPECYPELSNMAPVLPGVYSLLPTDPRLYEDEEKVTAMPDVRVTTETAALQSCGPASTDTLSVSLPTSTDAVSSNEESGAATQVQILIFLLISCLACNEWPQLTDSARVCQGR